MNFQTNKTVAITKKVAVLSDIHSNYYAFKACFEDALSMGAQGFVFLGDYVSDLSEVRATLDLLYDIIAGYPTVCLRGNRERYMLNHRDGISHFSYGAESGSLFYTFERLKKSDIAFFESLGFSDTVNIGGVSFELAHSTMDNDRCYFDHLRGNEKIFSQMKCQYLLVGHSHKQFVIEKDGKTIINPGSVGVPQCGDPLSQYAILEIADAEVSCSLRRVPYDVEKAIHAQFESGLVDAGKYWPIGVLYDVITGKEHCIKLLERVLARNGSLDESVWHDEAQKIGMRFTAEEIIEDYRKFK